MYKNDIGQNTSLCISAICHCCANCKKNCKADNNIADGNVLIEC